MLPRQEGPRRVTQGRLTTSVLDDAQAATTSREGTPLLALARPKAPGGLGRGGGRSGFRLRKSFPFELSSSVSGTLLKAQFFADLHSDVFDPAIIAALTATAEARGARNVAFSRATDRLRVTRGCP